MLPVTYIRWAPDLGFIKVSESNTLRAPYLQHSTPGLSCFGKVKHPSFDYHYMLHAIYIYMQMYHAA